MLDGDVMPDLAKTPAQDFRQPKIVFDDEDLHGGLVRIAGARLLQTRCCNVKVSDGGLMPNSSVGVGGPP